MAITDKDLKKRLKPRPDCGTWRLELRGSRWGDIGRVAVRKPGSDGWPTQGPTTTDKDTAEEWLEDPAYLRWIERRIHVHRHGSSLQTVREAIDAYLERLLEEEGEDFSTYRNRSTSLVRHTEPVHDSLLVDVDYETMRQLLDNVRVQKSDGSLGRPAVNTLRSIRAGMTAVWREAVGGPPPWRGLKLGDERQRKVRQRIREGEDVWSLLRGGGYNESQVANLVVAGRYRDMHTILPSPALRAVTLPITDAILAFIACTGMRESEARHSQWHDIDWERGIRGLLLIRGTKTAAGLRVQPVQDALLPWLNYLRDLYTVTFGREPLGEDYIIQGSPKAYRTAPLGRGMIERVSRVQTMAGLKRDQKATNIMRSTWVSNAIRHKLEDRKLKLYVGHGLKGRDVSDVYMNVEAAVEDADYRIMDHVPSPDEVSELVKSYTPVVPPPRGAGA